MSGAGTPRRALRSIVRRVRDGARAAGPAGPSGADRVPAATEPAPAEAAETAAAVPPAPRRTDMPALSGRFGAMQDFYRFAFLMDGYPGRAEPDGSIFAHPIYGSYVLRDYLQQHDRAPSDELRAGIRTVAEATVARMSEFRGTLVFWYEADPTRGARLYERHYSALTQGYYAIELHRAGVLLGDDALVRAAARVFESLLVPAADGGVHYADRLGVTVAEVPQRPNSWILNGWMSCLASVHRYAELSGSEAAWDLFRTSARTMAAALPLYDDPGLRISRYGLTGFVYLRLRFDTTPAAIGPVALDVPGEASVELPVGGLSRWQGHVFAQDVVDGVPQGSTVRLNAVLSLASAPDPNVLAVTVTAPSAGAVVLEGIEGAYDPRRSSPTGSTWVELGRSEVRSGEQTVTFAIPRKFVEGVVYPTNFVKVVDGQNVNIYHGVHINRLREIGRLAGLDEMLTWADRWEAYIAEWPSMPVYEGLAMRSLRTGKVTPLTDWEP